MGTDKDLGAAATAVGTQPQRAAPAAAPASVLADRYEILGMLGMGGMGRVYRVHDRALDETVALKLLRRELIDADGVELFRQEVKLARRVTSPHVVRTFDLGQHGDDYFLTMEYIDGRSLAQLLDDRIPLDEVVRVARAVATGIAAAHENGVLHRDLKPDNVLVGRNGRIVITDFGIARLSTAPVATRDRFVGTPAYMAPEQLESGATIGPAADIYAFGAVLFEMLTGRRPFIGTDPIQVALARLHEAPPDPRTLRAVPDALAELALRCLARRPADRPRDCEAVLAELASQHALVPTARASVHALDVPSRTSRSVALLPLRATGDLAELGDGLSEEIADAMSMTRALRVRPLGSVRKLVTLDADPRDIGRALGVDIVIDGSIRRRGTQLRIAARAIGVDDGFQLWASHVDTTTENLLTATDDVVRAIALALTVEIDLPARSPIDPRATELYLENKAKLRAQWIDGVLGPIVDALEQAHALSPEDALILATLALARARFAFYGDDASLPLARRYADRAVSLSPSSGEAWLALGVACLYAGAPAESALALSRAVACAPGSVTAQALLGAMLLEAGDLDQAISHLEAARSLDPQDRNHVDLPRAYIYADRYDDGIRELERALATPGTAANRVFDLVSIARFKMWRGERFEFPPIDDSSVPDQFRPYFELAARIHGTGQISASDQAQMESIVRVGSVRLRASRCQFMAEFMLFAGNTEDGLDFIQRSVDAGLHDHAWLVHCPLIEPLRSRPELAAAIRIVAARSRAVLDSLRTGPR